MFFQTSSVGEQTRDFQILAHEDMGDIAEGVDSVWLKGTGRSTSRTVKTRTENGSSEHLMPSQQKKKKKDSVIG